MGRARLGRVGSGFVLVGRVGAFGALSVRSVLTLCCAVLCSSCCVCAVLSCPDVYCAVLYSVVMMCCLWVAVCCAMTMRYAILLNFLRQDREPSRFKSLHLAQHAGQE